MELFRCLGCLIEAPGDETGRLAELLGLGSVPGPAEHTNLFLFQLYPLASVYLDNQGKIGGEARDRIAGFWRALGLAPPVEPDHLAILLAFLSLISDREAQAQDPADRERWQRVRRAFLWEHLLSWVPIFLDKLNDLDGGFYRRWSGLLADSLLEEARSGPRPPILPLHLRQAEPLPDPRAVSGEALLEGLTSPVRCGFILVRSDLERAGRELGLGVRKGERRYVLEALLGQDDVATLQWLAREAARAAERHRGWVPQLGDTAGFWVARALRSARLLTELAAEAAG